MIGNFQKNAAVFGARYLVSAHLVRKTESDNGRGWGDAKKVWRRSVYAEPRIGVLIGLRTLSNGHRSITDEEPVAYKAYEHMQVAIFAFDMRSKPLLVLFSDIRT